MRERSENWFAEMFWRTVDSVVDIVRDIVSDVRDKLVFEGWFGRRTPEHQGSNLEWFQDRPATSDPKHEYSDALSQFYDRLSPAERAEHFSEPLERDISPAAREPDRAIDL